MKIIKPEFEILTEINGAEILKRVERAGRTCYRSENKITADSAKNFIKRILKAGHLSVIEHENISVRIVCDRGVTHELVRHRLAAYSQESTRYVNYSRGGAYDGSGLIVIKPIFFEEGSEKYKVWVQAMEEAEKLYLKLCALGASGQEARTVLPNSLKTEIVMTANLRQWCHVFNLRINIASHPQMREIMKMILAEFNEKIPVIFEDLAEKYLK